MRHVSVIFVGISSLKFDSPAVLGKAQKAISITQQVLQKYEGTLRQFIVDGTVGARVIVIFHYFFFFGGRGVVED
jgi:hypothetical protein